MATLKYDVSDVEAGGGGEEPQPGLYKGKVVSVVHRTKKKNGDACNDLEVVIDIGPQYVRLWRYIQMDDNLWKLREFTDALSLPVKGDLTPQKLKSLANKPVNVRIKSGTNQDGDPRGEIKNLFRPGEGGEPIDAAGNGASADASDGEVEVEITAEVLAEWSDDDIKEEMAAREIKIGRFNRTKAIDAILEQVGVAPDEETAAGNGSALLDGIDEAAVAELSVDADYYSEWTDDDVDWLVDTLGIGGNVPGRKTKANKIKAVVSFAEQALGEDGEGSEDGEGGDSYDEWTLDDLKGEINDRIEQGAEIEMPKGRVTTSKLIDVLREDDAKAERPF